ncbi:MAG: FHA domain-containing protein [Clostridia bacterium]|nr:FHA domain-containing protein [Clostridia bacterium]
MNPIRCINGHFYDPERFDTCPFCNQTTVSAVDETTGGSPVFTMPVSNTTIIGSAESESEETRSYFNLEDKDSNVKHEPTVGWVVAIDGPHQGEDYRLKTGRNFVGRADNMDVSLPDDKSVARESHSVVVYDPKANIYLVAPGDAKELCYLNDSVVLAATQLKINDVISVGNTKLLFIPCCSDKFTWDSVIEANKEKGKE